MGTNPKKKNRLYLYTVQAATFKEHVELKKRLQVKVDDGTLTKTLALQIKKAMM